MPSANTTSVTSVGLFVCSLSDVSLSRKFLRASNCGHWLCPLDKKKVFTFSYTGLFKMNIGVLTTCHTQYTWDRSICIFLFNT